MVKFDFGPLEEIAAAEGLRSKEYQKYNQRFPAYLKAFKSRKQDFLEVLDDRAAVKAVKNFADGVKGVYREIVVLGIGGSALGARCIGQALGKLFEKDNSKTRLTVLDNIDPVLLSEFEQSVDLRRTLFLVVTKSGGTAETLAQFLYFKNRIVSKKLDWKKHFVFVTDPDGGLLRKLAGQTPGLPVFPVPQKVGGRFSALTVVGLLPAALAGFKIDNILTGARKGRTESLKSNTVLNPAWRLALTQYLLYKKGKSITVFWPYAQKLRGLADWYGQLLAESIGKKFDRKGRRVEVGITPVAALGASDQHAQNQLYNEGPNDKLFLFLEVARPETDLKISRDVNWHPPELSYLENLSFNRLLLKELEGTFKALVKQNRPSVKITLDKLDAESLGQLLVILEMSVAYLGELFGIDAYDQPGVELSKKLTRAMLVAGK